MDALIKMLKENGNTHGYSFGASMIAKTIETSPCVTDIARMDRDPNVGSRNQHESSPAPVGTNQSPHLDREGGRESETQEDGQDGAGLSQAGEGGTREPGDSKALVTYTAQPSLQNNRENEYLRRSDLDSLIKMLKENGNTLGTLGYSFGASYE
ncbi:hypothetical protein IGI04_042922, partial [Brassica rapa subsp. trilocularis]